ncbi:hypothetical protein [Fluviicola sp.]|jgi:hypothetical protein|uniref:hypothetical protein n=1 Tax=Fluviicola sp. TaxID=1917219 RepID=UPI002818063C|nr:hypothetical protein [Fluviicola sp.]MDR0801705.1 hypothetical protein [Fluviicola sp.]
MKQSIFKLLSCSLILLFALSCKKKKGWAGGFFDGFPPGKFDAVWIFDQNGTKDTLSGEFSGPYPIGTGYNFIHQLVPNELIGFSLNSRSGGRIDNVTYYWYPHLINAKIVNSQVNKNNMFISYNSGDTLTGTINLTRKQ